MVLSALLFRGRVSALRPLWQSGRIVPLVSTATAGELLRALAYPKFRLNRAEQGALASEYLPQATLVRPEDHPNALEHVPICRDPDDQAFLDLAQAGAAAFLVTGDRDLLDLDDPLFRHLGFAIVSPARFLEELAG